MESEKQQISSALQQRQKGPSAATQRDQLREESAETLSKRPKMMTQTHEDADIIDIQRVIEDEGDLRSDLASTIDKVKATDIAQH